jgi:hypothetical protein
MYGDISYNRVFSFHGVLSDGSYLIRESIVATVTLQESLSDEVIQALGGMLQQVVWESIGGEPPILVNIPQGMVFLDPYTKTATTCPIDLVLWKGEEEIWHLPLERHPAGVLVAQRELLYLPSGATLPLVRPPSAEKIERPDLLDPDIYDYYRLPAGINGTLYHYVSEMPYNGNPGMLYHSTDTLLLAYFDRWDLVGWSASDNPLRTEMSRTGGLIGPEGFWGRTCHGKPGVVYQDYGQYVTGYYQYWSYELDLPGGYEPGTIGGGEKRIIQPRRPIVKKRAGIVPVLSALDMLSEFCPIKTYDLGEGEE